MKDCFEMCVTRAYPCDMTLERLEAIVRDPAAYFAKHPMPYDVAVGFLRDMTHELESFRFREDRSRDD